MRWDGQLLDAVDGDALPGLEGSRGLLRTFDAPEFRGMEFLEVTSKSALNKVPGNGFMGGAWTVNPYRGCQHACVYCLSPDTPVLMASGRHRAIGDLVVGDEIVGTRPAGDYRRYVHTRVLAVWVTRKRAFRVTLADGTEIVASGDHRFLTERGWKFVTGAMGGPRQRPYLTTNNHLMGFGSVISDSAWSIDDDRYRRGYLTGMIRGDGMIFHGDYTDDVRTRRIHRFRLALADGEALDRTRSALAAEGVATYTRPFSAASDRRREVTAIHTARRSDVEAIEALIAVPAARCRSWSAGFLAGIFDAEGSCSRGVLRIANTNCEIIRLTCEALTLHGIPHVVEPARPNGVRAVRVVGGLPARQRLFALADPAITRKMSIEGLAVKSVADLAVVSIEDLGGEIEMVDITTGTGDFLANGVISHNCFARQTHTYLDLDAGADFDSRVVVKTNVAEALDAELTRRRERPERVLLGTNTDPYQRAEGRYRLMPGIIRALAKHGVGISILTKGTLLRRDLPVLAEVAERVPVDLQMSIAIFDDALQASVEPGTPTTAARLATVRAIREAGLGCGVLVMPVLPWLTDSEEHLDRAFSMLAEAGATSVATSALHLRPGAREWYLEWLAREHPHLVERYRRLYAGGTNAEREYQDWLKDRVRTVRRRHPLQVFEDRRRRWQRADEHAAAAPVVAEQPLF